MEPAGRRSKDVCLTPAGRALAERTVARLIAVEKGILASWPAQDLEQYLALAERYLAALRSGIEDLHTE